MTTRSRRASAAIAVVAGLMLGSWNLASATSLHVEGGTLQSWEFEADLPAEPASGPHPDAAPSETGESQDLAEQNALAEPSTLPAPTAPPIVPPVSEPAASEPIPSQPIAPEPTTPEAEPTTLVVVQATPADPSPAPEPTGAPPVPEP